MTYSGLFLGSSLPAFVLCLACSSTFVSSGSDGVAGGAGAPHAGSGSAGDSNAAGTSSGGTSSGGSSGSTESGGTTSAGASGAVTGNGGSSAGSGGSSAGSGGSSAGSGGTPAGGSTSMGGAGGADCAALKTEYSAAVTKARVCDVGSTDECSKSSTLPALGCGCPTLVNAKSTYTTVAQKLYDQIQADKCSSGAICNIACLPATGASCAASTSGTNMAYVCTSSLAAAAN